MACTWGMGKSLADVSVFGAYEITVRAEETNGSLEDLKVSDKQVNKNLPWDSETRRQA